MRDSDRAYQAIIDQIFAGKLRCGQPIRDKQLQEELGVGKTPLREALFRLIQDGYITDAPHRGMFVASFDLAQLESMLNLRTVLTPYLCDQLLRNARSADIDACEQEMRGLIQPDMTLPDVFHADLRFHAMLEELSGDTILADILRKLEFMSSMALIPHARDYYQRENTINDEYFEIFRHIRERDRDALEAAIKRHIPRYVLQRSE